MALAESAPVLQAMPVEAEPIPHMEESPSYDTLKKAGVLTTAYRKNSFEDIFLGNDFNANTSKDQNFWARARSCVCPIVGYIAYTSTHMEIFVPAGHVGLMTDEQSQYLFAQPGMHLISSLFVKFLGVRALPVNNTLTHGNRCILVVEQGYVGVAFDNGQPVLFPPGIHVWTSETLKYHEAVALDKHVLSLGPYTLLTVDEGYAAITQNNGKQQVLLGGHTWFLDHKNWRFQKFLTLKIQTDDLEKIEATSADNITMKVTSTVTWKIVDPELAAACAADTMATGDNRNPAGNIKKLQKDVLKQAIASLASFVGGVNYSESFAVSASAAQGKHQRSRTSSMGMSPAAGARNRLAPIQPQQPRGGEQTRIALGEASLPGSKTVAVNAMYDRDRMSDSVAHANMTTQGYGVEILSINILSAVPVDKGLTKALAAGALASATALQAETAARGNAKAMKISAEAEASKAKILSEGSAQANLIISQAEGESARLVADGKKSAAELLQSSALAVELAKLDKGGKALGEKSKFFFCQEPSYLANMVLK